ncbi:MAG: histidine ammonia-lyase [Deltaproteobacteria bacterium]|nr:histidine ammonia-lyase [Deltaproteobacteria bacterium]
MDVTIGESLDLGGLVAVADGRARATLGARGREALVRARAAVSALLHHDAPATYGINTGFGALAEVRVADGALAELQDNLIRSHAVGVGPPLSDRAVRAMMLVRAQVLARGYSGCRPEVVELLVGCLERGVTPIIPSLGSVGACGDLAPLAHLALVLIGEGHAKVAGERLSGRDALARVGLSPLRLEAKEGLALINGTAAMLGVGGLALDLARTLVRTADVTGAMSLEALKGSVVPFDARIVEARPHPGALAAAAHLRALLADSAIVASHADCNEVQDAYSLRCMPQVHGSARDLLAFAERVIEVELDSATDNPLVLSDGSIRSGGNFHGQPVAAAFDVAMMGLVDVASIAERRLAYLVDHHRSRGLPPFLARQSGLHSGFMMAQVTAASLVAEARAMATPRSMDSIPTSAEREDHVSMGMGSARALAEVARLAAWVLAIEAVVAAQGVAMRGLAPGRGVGRALAIVRERVPPLDGDRALAPDFEAALELVESGRLVVDPSAAM